MAAAFSRTQLEVERIGVNVSIPNNPKARLMYYLNCICTVLDLDESDSANLRRLQNYQEYYHLSDEESDQLFLLCLLISPDVLLNKVIFQDDDMCGNSGNEFYKVSQVRNQMVVSSSIMIAGKTRRVNKIMFFKMPWLRKNFLEPIRHFKDEMDARTRRRRRQENDCTVM